VPIVEVRLRIVSRLSGTASPRMKESLVHFLLSCQNADGSWGYTQGARGSLEPTAYAVMSLHDTEGAQMVAAKGLNFIKSSQNNSGGWPVNTTDGEATAWVSALAGLALLASEQSTAAVQAAEQFLLRSFGKTRKPWVLRIADWMQSLDPAWVDKNYGGWSWNPDTARWVEPTSYALLFLKQLQNSNPAHGGEASRQAPSAILEAERLLCDRICQEGGWNYGNARVLGEELRPFPLTTAVALMALQDRPELGEVQTSLNYLENAVKAEKSALTISLACLCFDIFARESSPVLKGLQDLYARTRFFGNVKTTATALLALRSAEGWKPFRVARDSDPLQRLV